MSTPASTADFYRLANFFYRSVGIVPYDRLDGSAGATPFLKFIFYFGFINMNYVMVSEIIYSVLAFGDERFVEAITSLSYVGFVLVANNKMVFVWRNQALLNHFMHSLEHAFPQTRKTQMQFELTKYLQRSRRITIGFTVLYMILIWTYNLSGIVQYMIYDRLLGLIEVGPTLPYGMYIAWQWRDNWTYYLLYVSQTLAGYVSAAGQIASDLLLVGTAMQVIMHYDYISRTFERHTASGTQLDMDLLKYLVEYHCKVLGFSNKMNACFGLPIFLNFVTSSVVICFLGFQMTIGFSIEIMFKLLLYFVSSTAQVYLLCYSGQQLIIASEGIADAVYNHDWHEAKLSYKKMLLQIAQRAQQPALLKATNYVHVSHATMTRLLRISYNFFALIRTMYGQ